MIIYLGNDEDDSTRSCRETIKALSEKLYSVLKGREEKGVK